MTAAASQIKPAPGSDDLTEVVEAAMRSTTLCDHIEALRPDQPDVVNVFARTVAQVLRRKYTITAKPL